MQPLLIGSGTDAGEDWKSDYFLIPLPYPSLNFLYISPSLLILKLLYLGALTEVKAQTGSQKNVSDE